MSSSPPPNSSVKPLGWNPIVITVVGLSCLVFLAFGYYKLLRGNCSCHDGERVSRSAHFRRRFLNHGLESPDNPSVQFQSRGLDSLVMRSIPITQFRKDIEEGLEKGKGTDCAVCLGEFEEGEWVKNLPNCLHVFHVACIDTWFLTHSSCPLCRSCMYVLAMHSEYEVSMMTLRETLGTEGSSEEGSRQNETLRAHI